MKNSDQPIIPFWLEKGIVHPDQLFGLTKREYFAGLAMQGLLSNSEWMKQYQGEKYLMQTDVLAEVALKSADELLKQLEKSNP